MKKSLLLLTLMVLLTPWAVKAQSELTVHDGTSTNSYLPAYGLYVDTQGSTSEFIIPADDLSEMSGGSISKLTFYLSTPAAVAWTATIQVYLAEVDNTTLSSVVGPDACTVVYTGTLDATGTTMEIEFDDAYSYDGGNLLIGTYVQVAGNYKSASFYGENVTGAGYHHHGTSNSAQNFIPKTTFEYTPAGGGPTCVKPKQLAASNVLHNHADISWSSEDTDFELVYSTDEDFDPASESPNAVANPCALDGLNPLTDYYVYVRTNCGSEQSDWSSKLHFKTTAQADEVGAAWSDDFEGALSWELINGEITNAWVLGSAVSNGGSQSLYISNDKGESNAYTITSPAMVYAVKLLNFEQGKFEFSFDWLANGESNYDYLRVALVPASVTLTAGTSVPSGFSTTALPSGWIALDGGGKLNLVTEWQSQSVAINVAAGNYYLVLAWRDDTSSGTQPPAAVDNVSITKIACEYDVADLAVSGIATNAAALSWTAGEATQWQVSYSSSSSFESPVEAIVSAASYQMTGLTPATTYYAKVRAYCGGEDFGAWSEVISFMTECEAFDLSAADWSENFDSYTASTGFLPICWSRINGGTSYSSYPYVYGYNAKSTSNCLYFYTSGSSSSTSIDDQYVILPAMDNLAGRQITLWAKGANATSSFKIGLMSNPSDASTFVQIAEQALTTSYQELFYLIPSNTTAKYVAIMMPKPTSSTSATYGVYIDDISIQEAPQCAKPTALSYSEIKNHSVKLSWTENGEAEAWQIAYRTIDETAFTETEQITTNPYTLTGLIADTTYVIKVRSLCSVESEWSSEINVTTLIACAAPTNLVASDIKAHSDSLKWKGTSDAYIVSYRTAEYYLGLHEEFKTSSIPAGWEQKTGLLQADGSVTFASGSQWYFGTSNGVFDSHAKINIYGSGSTERKGWLISPKFVIGNVTELSFDLALTAYSGTLAAPQTTGTDDKFIVLISTDDDMASWTILRQWDNDKSEYVYNNIASTATGEHVQIDLSAYQNQRVRIAFYGESTVSNADNNLHIDNVSCGELVPAGAWQTLNVSEPKAKLTGLAAETLYDVKVQGDCGDVDGLSEEIAIQFTTAIACPAPSALAASEVVSSSAKLSWTENGEAQAWIVAFKLNDATAFTEINVSENPYVLEGLDPDTIYNVKVRANCGGLDGESEETAVISFRTLKACPVPVDLAVADVLAYSAKLSWLGESENYRIITGQGDPITLLNVDFADQAIPADFVNTSSYPWTIVANGDGYCMQSSNAGVGSSTSEISLSLNVGAAGSIEFDAKCMGEGTTTAWDKCIFSIDGEAQFSKGQNGDQWDHYSFDVAAGEHIFTWKYSKDGSVNPTGDYFAVSSIVVKGSNIIWGTDQIETNELEHEFTELTPETHYFVKVQGVCGSVETEFSEVLAFKTLPTQQVVITSVGLATYYNEYAYEMPDGITGYAFASDNHFQMAYEAGDTVAALVPLILEGEEGTYELAPTLDPQQAAPAENLLKGVLKETVVANQTGYKFYVLSLNADGDEDSAGFYWYNADGSGGFTMPAHKAYLKLSDAQANNAPGFIFDENVATSLDNLKGVEGTLKFIQDGNIYLLREGVIYDATGRKVRTLE